MEAAFSRSGWLSEPVSILPFEQGMFPREGGDPDWAPAFAGEQGRMRSGIHTRYREDTEPFLRHRTAD